MVDIITRDVAGSELKEVVGKLIPDSMADDIRKACHSIFPLKDVNIRKVYMYQMTGMGVRGAGNLTTLKFTSKGRARAVLGDSEN